jgi:hypothetical protein
VLVVNGKYRKLAYNSRWPYPKRGASWPPPEPPGLDPIARFNKIHSYFRVRDLEDARRRLAFGGQMVVGFC